MGQGGVATDVTDQLHPRYHDWVRRIVEFLNVGYFALDIIGESAAADPLNTAKALEINAKPEWMHHTFSEVRTHDIAEILLDVVFGK